MRPCFILSLLALLSCTAAYATTPRSAQSDAAFYNEFILVKLRFPERDYNSAYDIDVKANDQGNIFIPLKELKEIFYGQIVSGSLTAYSR